MHQSGANGRFQARLSCPVTQPVQSMLRSMVGGEKDMIESCSWRVEAYNPRIHGSPVAW